MSSRERHLFEPCPRADWCRKSMRRRSLTCVCLRTSLPPFGITSLKPRNRSIHGSRYLGPTQEIKSIAHHICYHSMHEFVGLSHREGKEHEEQPSRRRWASIRERRSTRTWGDHAGKRLGGRAHHAGHCRGNS